MIEQVKLANGVSVIMEKMDSVRSIAVGIFIKNGSVNEDQNNNGISHFIEHMLFKGTYSRSAQDIAEQMDLIGGQLNAYTSKEYTCYYSRVLDIHFENVMDILADMIFNSKFEQQEIDRETNVILEEISMYEDSPEDFAFSQLQKGIWKGSSLGYPILGSVENIKSFKREDFLKFLDERYTANNTVISVAGNFDRDIILEKIEKYFSKMKKGQQNSQIVTAKYNPIKLKIEKNIEQLHLYLVFEGVSLIGKYTYAMSLLNTIFGGGLSSILFQKVREAHGLAYSIYSSNISYTGCGSFNIYAALNPSQYEKFLQVTKQEISNLKNTKISSNQIKQTKEQLKSAYIMGLESTNGRMSSIGRAKILTNNVKTPDETIDIIDNISQEDINFLIDTIFDFDRMSISIAGKVKGINL